MMCENLEYLIYKLLNIKLAKFIIKFKRQKFY